MASSSGQNVGYIRVSTVDQNEDLQLDDITLDRSFVEKASGGSVNRPVLKQCLDYLRDGDELHVHSIDRLARNLFDLQGIIKILNNKGVSVVFYRENLSFTVNDNNPMSNLMLQMMGAFAEFERALIKERQREGIAKAKAQGKQFGRKRALDDKQVMEIKMKVSQGESKSGLAKVYGVSRQTIYTALDIK